ncbi:FAD:protein FMN transferase [Candidatus Giovannonibacteria bacterium]|nr:FAD:protein FMN transferase [Candidatus Giovannonibacteria bacterium]
MRPVHDYNKSIKILDSTHIETFDSVLIDIGALGKGYFVDKLDEYLKTENIKKFLVNGSGDIRYFGNEKIQVGLEHPSDKNKVIGKVDMGTGAMCASGCDRRQWGDYHHIIDPASLTSPKNILSTWVIAGNAALADALATCLFLAPPENFESKFKFEYCILNSEMLIKKSEGFHAEFY